MRKTKTSLKIKYSFYGVLILSGIFLVAGSQYLTHLETTSTARLQNDLELHANLFQHGCVDTDAFDSLPRLRAFSDELMTRPYITGIRITELPNFNLVARVSSTSDRDPISSRAITGANGEVIGELQLQYTHAQIVEETDQARKQLLLLYLLILNGLALPWVWFNGTLDRTYGQVISTLKRVDSGDLKTRIDPNSGGLLDVAKYFNQMLDSIEQSNGKLHLYATKLAEKNSQLNRDAVVRKNAERLAQQNERKFYAIFNQTFQLIGMIRPDGNIREMNENFLKVMDARKEDVRNRPFTELPIWGNDPEIIRKIHLAIRNSAQGNFYREELCLKNNQGEDVYYDFSLKPVIDENGSILMLIPEGRDITGRVKAEIALQETEAQVRQSQKMEAIGRLAGGIAHDFNNLLTSILGFSNMVMESLDPQTNAESREDLQEVIFASEKARGLTQKLLMLARKKIYHVEPIHLNEMLNQMEKIIQISLHEDIELVTDYDRDIEYIEADSVSLEQIIINLAVNAKDAMPRSGRLYITTRHVELDEAFLSSYDHAKPGDYVMLSVRDTGSGIPPEVAEHIFEPFFTTKEPGKGTGLGLATVYGLVHQFGGIITLETEPGRGTEFRLLFPETSYAPVETATDSNPIRDVIPHGTETILLVEDESAVRKLGKRMVESLGYEVLMARDGEQAIEVYESHPGKIDMVVTDVVMPRMSGPDMVRRLLSRQADLKFMYVSGFTKDKMMVHGADDDAPILQKPYSIEQLGCKMREVLDKANAQKVISENR
jgi:two-component system, cell cycle sensor histidine kinase and response regulator CckA